MSEIRDRFYAASQVRALDEAAIRDHGMTGAVLMRRAAAAAWRVLCRHWPHARRLLVVCGPGNNGGDGYELARIARDAGLKVQLAAVAEPRPGSDAAAAAAAWWAESGARPVSVREALAEAELVVDALLGTGTSRAPAGPFAEAIRAIDASGLPVLALDLPSGLAPDTGVPFEPCVRASVTVSFVGRKFGLHTGHGPSWAGKVEFDTLGVPDAVYRAVPALAGALCPADLRAWLPHRRAAAHKNRHGHVLVIGGNRGMGGAALLAARAALRGGAGLVSVACHTRHIPAVIAAQPELMADDADTALSAMLDRADVVVIGPGLGRDGWARTAWKAVNERSLPQVVDADALSLLAEAPTVRDARVITPHPGEAGRLLETSAAAVQADRLAAIAELHRRFGGTVVLKGAGSLVKDAAGTDLCAYGNPGMAVGGTGDVLAGLIGALIGQGLDVPTAARAGVLAHALAGDRAAGNRPRGMLPSDLTAQLRAVLNP